MRIRISYYNILSCLSVLWLIIISGVVTIVPYNNRFIFDVIGMIIISVFLIRVNKKRDTKKSTNIFLFIMIILVSFQMMIEITYNYIYYGCVKLIIIFVFSYLIVTRISLDKIIKYYINIIFIIAFVSIILYMFNDIIIRLQIFSTIQINSYEKYINLYIYCILNSVSHRNCGIFWEPGAFAVFLNLALFFTLFYDKNSSHSKIKITVFIIAILTTISTQGYISLLILVIAYFIADFSKNKIYVLLLSLMVIIIGTIYLIPLISSSFSYKFGIGGNELSINVTSRINPFILDLYMIRDNPLGIIGVDRYADILLEYGKYYNIPYASSSCTPSTTTAVFGLIPGLFMIIQVYLLPKIFCENRIQTIILGIFLINIFMTESFLIYGLYYFLVFLSIENRKSPEHNFDRKNLIERGI